MNTSNSRPRRSWFRRLLRYGFWTLSLLFLLGLGALLLYAWQLDAQVREKFEGKRWALPARVYAQPLELYAGLSLEPEDLAQELERLAYRQEPNPQRPGTYKRKGNEFWIRTRAFRFWDGAEPERFLRLRFKAGQLISLQDEETGEDLPLVRLDAVLIASIYPTHHEDRILLRGDQLPQSLIDTLIAVEDRAFFQHFGINPMAILRAMVHNLRAGTVVEGGSTLTQQLVKNFYLTQERSLKRKLNEALMAFLLELHYSKMEILEAYANEIFLGQDGNRAIHGFGLASRFYFNRDLSELNRSETALLVALIKGPSYYDPRRFPKRALARRNLVLDLLKEQGILDEKTAEQAKQAPLGVTAEKGGRPSGAYPAFLDLVRRQLQRDYREEDLRSEGLRIFTTLSPRVQSKAEQVVRERLPQLEQARHFPPETLETSVVVVSAAQGEVLALLGGRNAGYAGFNRALNAIRPIGSLIKPVIYLRALSDPEHYNLATPLSDRPVRIRAGDDFWTPQNYDRRTHGNVPLYKALAKSYNLATVHLGLELGVEEVVQMLGALGVQRPVRPVPALLLGSVSLAPVEVAQVYQTLAAGGFRAPLKTIREVLDAKGRPLNRYPLAVEPAARAESVYLLTWALRQVVEQGTATWLKKRLPEGLIVAGKTGTTNGLRDSWFAGFSGDKVAVVWVGRDDNQPTRLTGSSGALRIWGDLMASIENQPLQPIPPEGIEEVRLDPANGLLAPKHCRRAKVFPVDKAGLPLPVSSCGRGKVGGKAPAREPPSNPQEKPQESGGGFGEFLRDFFGD